MCAHDFSGCLPPSFRLHFISVFSLTTYMCNDSRKYFNAIIYGYVISVVRNFRCDTFIAMISVRFATSPKMYTTDIYHKYTLVVSVEKLIYSDLLI